MRSAIESVKINFHLSRNESLNESVYQAFRTSIILGDILAGNRINELAYASELNISRTPIRYALKRLEEENLVMHKKGVGTIVIGLTEKDAHEIFEIRKALDTMATLRAMELMTEIELGELKSILESGERLIETGDVNKILENFSEFDDFLYAKSSMKRLEVITHRLRAYLIYFREMSVCIEQRKSEGLSEHWDIYRAIIEKDPCKVERAVHAHLEKTLNDILLALK